MTAAALFVAVSYVALQLISNIASVKVGFVWGYAVDMGVFLYPLTFTLRDLVHRELGRELTRKCIYFAVFLNLLMSAYFAFIAKFPPDPSSTAAVAFGDCLAPVWRIVAFSLLAQLVSELVDTEVYHVYEKRFGEKRKWGRVLVSNTVSIPVDNAVFCVGAFAGTYARDVVWQIFLFNFIVKYAISLISIPLIYLPSSNDRHESVKTHLILDSLDRQNIRERAVSGGDGEAT